MTIPTKSLLLNSHRGSKPKVDPIKMPVQSQQLSAQHSRYHSVYVRKMSVNSNTGVVSGRHHQKDHHQPSEHNHHRKEK